MAYDPADLALPGWLLRWLDRWVRLQIPLGRRWTLGFTRPGLMFTAALAGVWAAAFYSGNNLLYLAGSMLVAVAVAALLRARRMLREASALLPGALPWLTAGETHFWRKELPAPRSDAGILSVHLLVADGGGEALVLYGRWEPASTGEPAGRMRWQGSFCEPRRGVRRFDTAILTTEAPIGLYRLSLARPASRTLVTLPQPLAWNWPGRVGERGGGREGDEWTDLRAYQAGDPLSRVHWRKAFGEPRDWSVKRFGSSLAEASDTLAVDLRAEGEALERMLGRARFWLEQHPAPRLLVLGSRRFPLHDEAQLKRAHLALAEARPGEAAAPGAASLVLTAAAG